MAVNEGLTWNKKSFIASPASGNQSCGGEIDPSDSQRKPTRLFFLSWTFLYEGGCSQFLISSRKCDSSICGWRTYFPFSVGKITSFASSLLE